MLIPFTFCRAKAYFSASNSKSGISCCSKADQLVVELTCGSRDLAICLWRSYLASLNPDVGGRIREASEENYVKECVREHAAIFDQNLKAIAVRNGLREYSCISNLPKSLEVFSDGKTQYVATPYSTHSVGDSLDISILSGLHEIYDGLVNADRHISGSKDTCYDPFENCVAPAAGDVVAAIEIMCEQISDLACSLPSLSDPDSSSDELFSTYLHMLENCEDDWEGNSSGYRLVVNSDGSIKYAWSPYYQSSL